jgi:hypothetical protein
MLGLRLEINQGDFLKLAGLRLEINQGDFLKLAAP